MVYQSKKLDVCLFTDPVTLLYIVSLLICLYRYRIAQNFDGGKV